MTINITLFIQVFHFFVAYLIISKILLKPGVKIIKDEEKVEADLHSSIIKEQIKLEQKINNKQLIELKNFNEFVNIKPNLDAVWSEKVSWLDVRPLPVSQEELESISSDLTQYLIKKVENVELC